MCVWTHIHSSNVVLIGLSDLLHDLHLSLTAGFNSAFNCNGSLRIVQRQVLQTVQILQEVVTDTYSWPVISLKLSNSGAVKRHYSFSTNIEPVQFSFVNKVLSISLSKNPTHWNCDDYGIMTGHVLNLQKRHVHWDTVVLWSKHWVATACLALWLQNNNWSSYLVVEQLY